MIQQCCSFLLFSSLHSQISYNDSVLLLQYWKELSKPSIFFFSISLVNSNINSPRFLKEEWLPILKCTFPLDYKNIYAPKTRVNSKLNNKDAKANKIKESHIKNLKKKKKKDAKACPFKNAKLLLEFLLSPFKSPIKYRN